MPTATNYKLREIERTEFVVNPQVVADYKTSGMLPQRHLEYIKAAR